MKEGSDSYLETVKSSIENAQAVHINRTKKIKLVDGIAKSSGQNEDTKELAAQTSPKSLENLSLIRSEELALEMEDSLLNADYHSSDDQFSYEDVFSKRENFSESMPSFSWLACCASDDKSNDVSTDSKSFDSNAAVETKVSVDKVESENRVKNLELYRLHAQFLRLSERDRQYWMHCSMKIVESSKVKRDEEDRMMQQMLISLGFTTAKLRDIQTLDIDGADRERLSAKLKTIREADTLRRAEAARRRQEEIAAAAERYINKMFNFKF